MIVHIFSVYDHKAKVFGRPFYDSRVELAVRNVTAAVRDPEQMLGKFPEDFDLFRLGEFDDVTGVAVWLPQAELVCKITQLMNGR